MKDLFRDLRRDTLVTGVLTVILGLVLLVWPGMALRLVGKLLGAAIAIYGVVNIVGYFSQDDTRALRRYGLVYGIAMALIGLFLFARSGVVASVVPLVCGIALLVSGVSELQSALDLRRMGDGRWWVTLVPAVITAILGLILVLNPFRTAALLVRVLGVVLIYQGVSHLLISGRVSRRAHSLKDDLKDIFDKDRPIETYFSDDDR